MILAAILAAILDFSLAASLQNVHPSFFCSLDGPLSESEEKPSVPLTRTEPPSGTGLYSFLNVT